MVRKRKSESEGEQFSDPSSAESSEQDQMLEDTWVFPIVQDDARRSVYKDVKVCCLNCILDNDLLA